MKRYVVKNEKNKTYKNMFGVTDYDIPMFDFRSNDVIFNCLCEWFSLFAY